MANFEIRLNEEKQEKELYLFGEFCASWDSGISDKVIFNFAVKEAKEIGKREKAREIKRILNN